jgi:hypothetical protein
MAVRHLLRRSALAEHHGGHAHLAVTVGHAHAVDGHVAESRHPTQRVSDFRGGHVLYRVCEEQCRCECELDKLAKGVRHQQ